jgi:hypothetical protein
MSERRTSTAAAAKGATESSFEAAVNLDGRSLFRSPGLHVVASRQLVGS